MQNLLGIYSAASILNDIYGISSLRFLLDNLFLGCVFPAVFTVVIMYWPIYFVDIKFVMLKGKEPYYEPLYNNLVHSIIIVPVIFEMLLTPMQNIDKNLCLLSATVILCTYLTFFFAQRYFTGEFCYPLLNLINFWQVALALLTFVAVFFSAQNLGFFVHMKIWNIASSSQEYEL